MDADLSRGARLRHIMASLAGAVWLWPTLAMLVVGGWRLNGPQLWRDEAATWSAATRSLAELKSLTATIDASIAPYYVFMHYWIRVFGDSEIALRMPSLLAAAATAGITATLGKRIAGHAVGIVAGLIVALTPAVSRFAQEARPYALVTFAVALATLLLVQAVERPDWWRWAVYALSVMAIGYLHLVALLIVPCHGLAVALWRWAGPRRWRWVVAAVVAGMAIAPLALSGGSQRDRQLVGMVAPGLGSLRSLPAELFFSVPIGWIVFVLAAGGACLLAAQPRVGEMPRLAALCLLVGWGFVSCVGLWVVSRVAPMWFVRYLLFAIPALGILAAVALVRLIRVTRVPAVAGTVVVLAGLGACGIPDHLALRANGAHDYFNYPSPSPWWMPPIPDLREAAAYLRAHQRPGDVLVFNDLAHYPWPALMMSYELRGGDGPADVTLLRSPAEQGDYFGTRCADDDVALYVGSTTRIWVLNVTRDPDADPHVGSVLDERYRAASAWHSADVNLTLYQRIGPDTLDSRP
jgi:mannosyltransferase